MNWRSIDWQDDCLILLDQTLLPQEVKYIGINDHRSVVRAIKQLQVRGAPAIGIAAAFGVVLAARRFQESSRFIAHVEEAIEELSQARPTAANLFWALKRQWQVLEANRNRPRAELIASLEAEAVAIAAADEAVNHRIGEYGADLLQDNMTVLTHCNAGALATSAYGTALAAIRVAVQQGKKIEVYVDETRPLLQGARLTTWELLQDKIPVTLITDSMAATVMKLGKIQAVLLGADRIAANGDVANKIGTYGLAILAKEHKIPFYVAAPLATIDLEVASGNEIPIEQRKPEEVTSFAGCRVAPEGVKVFNPAFDVTPVEYVTALITEQGIARDNWEKTLKKWKSDTQEG